MPLSHLYSRALNILGILQAQLLQMLPILSQETPTDFHFLQTAASN